MADIGEVRAKLIADIQQWSANIEKAKRDLGSLGPAVQQSASLISGVLQGLERGLASVVSVAAAFRIVESAIGAVRSRINELDVINKLSQQTGIAQGELSKFAFAAKLADVDLSDFTLSLKFFNRQLSEAQDSTSKAAALFRELGVDTKGGAQQGLLQLADAYRALPDGATKAALAIEQFSRAGTRLIPFLNQGAQGIRAAGKDLDDFAAAASPEAAQAAEKFNDEVKRLSLAQQGLATVTAERLLPALIEVTERLTTLAKADASEGIRKNGGAFQFLADTIRAAGDALVALDEARKRFGLGAILATPLLGAAEPLATRYAQSVRIAANRRRVFRLENGQVVQLTEPDAAVQARLQPEAPLSAAELEALGGGSTFGGGVASFESAFTQAARRIDPARITNILNQNKDAEKKAAQEALDRDVARAKGLEALRAAELDFARQRGATESELAERQAALNAASLNAIRAQAMAEQGKTDATATGLNLSAQEYKNRQAILEILRAEADAQTAFADAQLSRSQNIVSDLEARIAIEQRQGATRKELLVLAQQADAAQIASNQRAVTNLQNQIDRERELDGISTASLAKIESLTAQQGQFNDALARGPDHVRALHQEFINLGDTLDSIFATTLSGSLLGTNKDAFSQFGKQAGQALIGELIRSTVREKGLFDFKIKSNLLELVGFAGDSGQQAGQGFVGGLVSKIGGLFGGGAGGSSAGTAQAIVGATGIEGQTLAIPAGATATTGAATGAGGAAAGLGAIGGYIALAVIAIDTVVKGLDAANAEARKFTLANQSLATDASVRAAAFKQTPLLGSVFGGASEGVLKSLGGSTAGRLAISAIFPGAIFLTAPTAEHQVARSINELFVKAGVPRFQDTPFQQSVYGRDVATIIARSGGTPLAQALVAQGAQPGVEALRPIATDLGLNIFQGNQTRAAEFGNTVINNARALGLSARETKEQILTLAKAAGVDLTGALTELNAQFLAGIIHEKEYHDAALGVATILTDLPAAIDAGTVALAAFDKTGRLNLETLNTLNRDVSAIVGGGLRTIFEQDLAGADAKTRSAAIGKTIGDAVVQGAEAAFLQKDLLGQFLTKGSTELTAAVNEYIAGNVGSATKLRDQALKDIAKGTADAQKFLGPFAAFIGQTQNLLINGGTTAPASFGSAGFNIPRFDTGGVLPRTGIYMGHAGEHVYPADQHDALAKGVGEMVQLLTMALNVPSGGDVNVEAVLHLDGREVDRAQIYNRRYRRAGMVMPQQGLGIRG